MFLYALQRAQQVHTGVVEALQQAAESEQRPQRERVQARAALYISHG
jgi:hypothetical protein